MEWARIVRPEGARLLLRGVPWAPPALILALIVGGLAGSWAVAVETGSATAVSRHLFYLPVVLGAARFGLAGAAATAVAGGLLAGPLVPLEGAAAAANTPGVWGARAGFFLGIAVLVAVLAAYAQRARSSQLAAVEEKERLAGQRALLLQSVSHEFRTPLTTILGVAETLDRPGLPPAQRDQLHAALRRAAGRLNDLTAVVLAAAEERMEAAQEVIDLPGLVTEVAESLGHLRGRERVGFRGGPQRLVSDRNAIRLVVKILVENALKFSPPGSPVEVTTAVADGVVELRIRDRGPGLGEEARRKILEPFTQLHEEVVRARGGLGLSLFAADRIIRQLAGALDFRPAAGGGTEVVVHLPQRRTDDGLGDSPRPRPRRRRAAPPPDVGGAPGSGSQGARDPPPAGRPPGRGSGREPGTSPAIGLAQPGGSSRAGRRASPDRQEHRGRTLFLSAVAAWLSAGAPAITPPPAGPPWLPHGRRGRPGPPAAG